MLTSDVADMTMGGTKNKFHLPTPFATKQETLTLCILEKSRKLMPAFQKRGVYCVLCTMCI